MPHENADEARAQQNADAVGQGFDDGGDVGIAVQGVGDFGKDFGAAMVFTRSLGEAAGLKETAELPGNDGGLGGQVFAEIAGVGIMDKGNGSQHFVGYDQGSGHDGAGVEFEGAGVARGVQEIHEDGAATADRLP